MHGTGIYFAGVGPKDPALERFPDIKKKRKKKKEKKSHGVVSINWKTDLYRP